MTEPAPPKPIPNLEPNPATGMKLFGDKGPKTMGRHFHRWTLWGEKYTQRGRGMVAAIGEAHPVWFQERRCVRCNAIQERIVGLD